jgi:hypothetical protein
MTDTELHPPQTETRPKLLTDLIGRTPRPRASARSQTPLSDTTDTDNGTDTDNTVEMVSDERENDDESDDEKKSDEQTHTPGGG